VIWHKREEYMPNYASSDYRITRWMGESALY
jgi:hypothetical protein